MDLTSPTDWKFTELQELDSSLRCSICKEYFQTAMMLSCSHNFCSLCIRGHLQYTSNRPSRCPLCLKPSVDAELVSNRLVDQLVAKFAAIRSYLLKLEDSLPNSKMGNIVVVDHMTGHSSKEMSIRLSTKQTAVSNEIDLQEQLEINLANEDNVELLSTSVRQPVDSMSNGPLATGKDSVDTLMREKTPEPKQNKMDENISSTVTDGQVGCPVCQDLIPQRHINAHLDRCLHEQRRQKQPAHVPSSCSNAKSGVKRLPKLVYTMSLLPDKELNRKLVELGLPINGSRQVRVKRHQDFTVWYNAECDKENPRTIKEVAKQFLRVETDKTKASEKSGGLMAVSANISPIQQDGETERQQLRTSYTRKHNKSFVKLIDEVRNRKAKVSAKNTSADSNYNDEKSSVTTTPINSSFPREDIDRDSNESEDDGVLPRVTKSCNRQRINSSGSSSHSSAEPGQSHEEMIHKGLDSNILGSDDEMTTSQSILVVTGDTENEKLEYWTTGIDDQRQTLTGGQKLLQDGPPDNLTQLLNDDTTSVPESPISFSPQLTQSPLRKKEEKDVEFQPSADLLSNDDDLEEPPPKRSLRIRRNPRRATRYSKAQTNDSNKHNVV